MKTFILTSLLILLTKLIKIRSEPVYLVSKSSPFIKTKEDEITSRIEKVRLGGPGFGWDFLTDTLKFPPLDISYNTNSLTNDGAYLIPDGMATEDVKSVMYSDETEIIQKSSEFTSSTSRSTKKKKFKFWGSGSSHTTEYRTMMKEQQSSKSVTIRNKLVKEQYRLLASSKGKLHANFRNWIKDIASFLLINEAFARYYIERMLNEYGSHYVSRVLVGGNFYQETFIKQDYWSKYSSNAAIVASASQSGFFSSSSFSSTVVTSTHSAFTSYSSSIVNSYTKAQGGNYKVNMSASQWENTLPNNLVVVDREIEKISDLITPSNFPEYASGIVTRIAQLVEGAIDGYFSVNSVRGCANPNSINFERYSNEEEADSCEEKYRFGGTFGSSLYCNSYSLNGACQSASYPCNEYNVDTFARLCPPNYNPRLVLRTADPWLELNECSGNSLTNNGMTLFGGIYSNASVNVVTGSRSCPQYFQPISLIGCNNNIICLSKDLVNGVLNAVPFGGFTSSCNPQIEPSCSLPGYQRYFVNNFKGCDLFYCSKLKMTDQPQLIPLPISPNPMPSRNLVDDLEKINREQFIIDNI